MRRYPLGMQAALVAHVASTIGGSIGIEHLAIISVTGHADSIVITRDRREITDAPGSAPLAPRPPLEKSDHGFGSASLKVDPLESGPVVDRLVQRRLGSVKTIQISHETLEHPRGGVQRRSMPVQLRYLGSTPAAGRISPPMNSIFFPGWPYMMPYSARRLANCLPSSPGIL